MTIIDCSEKEEKDGFIEKMRKAIQSAHLNFLIGSGCSDPALKVLGNIEKDIELAMKKKDTFQAEKIKYDFIKPHFSICQELINGIFFSNNVQIAIVNYKLFIKNISSILFLRRNNILHRQANIFSTNYDLFIEYAMSDCNESIVLNDGFRRTPHINMLYKFSTTEFFNAAYNTGNLYNYQYELPIINLLKLHGSMNWDVRDNEIIQSFDHIDKAQEYSNAREQGEMENFSNCFSIVLPQKDKFRETVLNHTYYDLLRIYANELDRENVMLIVEGFSFADEHILEITKRALKNPTLQLVIFCYSTTDKENMENQFSSFQNVDICYNSNENINFSAFNGLLENYSFCKKREE